MNGLGYMYMNGEGGVEKDMEKAKELFQVRSDIHRPHKLHASSPEFLFLQKAADAGNADAQLNLGSILFSKAFVA